MNTYEEYLLDMNKELLEGIIKASKFIDCQTSNSGLVEIFSELIKNNNKFIEYMKEDEYYEV